MGNSSTKEDPQQQQQQRQQQEAVQVRSPRTAATRALSSASTTTNVVAAATPQKPQQQSPPAPTKVSLATAEDPAVYLDKLFGDNGIPVVFRWDKGGEDAFVTGTFDEWNVKIPMSQSGNDFVHIRNLPRGKHGYKFVVDNEWEFHKEQNSMVEASGNVINFVDLTDFKPKFENLPDLNLQVQQTTRFISESSELTYGNRIPDINDYTKEPPALPQHLRSIILNSKSGVPQHVSLDHLYCTARKDGIMVLGVSQKFQNKFVTTVYYSPVNGGYPSLVHPSRSSSSSSAAASGTTAAAASSSSSSSRKA